MGYNVDMREEGRQSIKIGITADAEIVDILDQIAFSIRRKIREGKLPKRGAGRPIGTGTIAAEIVERVIREHPELLQQFFEDEASVAIGEKARPKAARSR